eukprot:TCONS_00022353-protein
MCYNKTLTKQQPMYSDKHLPDHELILLIPRDLVHSGELQQFSVAESCSRLFVYFVQGCPSSDSSTMRSHLESPFCWPGCHDYYSLLQYDFVCGYFDCLIELMTFSKVILFIFYF